MGGRENMSKMDEYVKFLRALGSHERLAILELLEGKELSASEIEKNFYMEQSTASHHLNTLKRAGVVDTRKDGRNVFYKVNDNFMQNFYGDFIHNLHDKHIDTEGQIRRRTAVEQSASNWS
jgi:ArsR family transcriptional regulator